MQKKAWKYHVVWFPQNYEYFLHFFIYIYLADFYLFIYFNNDSIQFRYRK